MTLLVTLFLVLINIFNNITIISPNTETMTALSAWMISCIIFVFGAMVAYAGILYAKYMRSKVIRVGPKMTNGVVQTMTPEEIDNEDTNLKSVDKCLLGFFPIIFSLFNMAYWGFYAT